MGPCLRMGALPPILIVDDDPDDLFILKRLLSKGGVQNKVITFEDPSAVIDHLELESKNNDKRFMPCIVFTDLNMPGMSGVELTAWIRAHPALTELAVVIISSSTAPSDLEHAQAAGAWRFLTKYPSSETLRTLIAELPCSPG